MIWGRVNALAAEAAQSSDVPVVRFAMERARKALMWRRALVPQRLARGLQTGFLARIGAKGKHIVLVQLRALSAHFGEGGRHGMFCHIVPACARSRGSPTAQRALAVRHDFSVEKMYDPIRVSDARSP